MTWSEFKAHIRSSLEEPVASVWSDDSLLYWANETAKDFARKTKCERDEQYAPTVVGQESYELPDYTLEVIGVAYDGRALWRQSYTDWNLADTSTGTPAAFAADFTTLYLRPIPDAIGEIRYFRYALPEDITGDDSDMPFRSEYNTALEYGILARAYGQVENWQSAGECAARYNAELESARAQKAIERQARRAVTPVEVY